MIDRRPSRILAMQALCQLEVLADHFLSQLDEFLAEDGHRPEVKDYARGLVRETWENLPEVDGQIQAACEHWEVKRMTAVDRNVLRVGVCELSRRPDVPAAVVVDEAVEIGKAFGTGESGAFINGVLDAVVKHRGAGVGAEVQGSGATNGTV